MQPARRLVLMTALVASSPSAWVEDALAQNDDSSASSSGGGSGGVIIDKPSAGYGTSMTISALGSVGSFGNNFGLGLAGLFGIPIVEDGFIPSLNESFHLEFGAFTNVAFYQFGEAVWLSPAGGVRWDFHIFREFTAYAALRTGIALGFERASTNVYLDGAVGGFWRFSKPIALRFELGGGVVGSGAAVGVAFFL